MSDLAQARLAMLEAMFAGFNAHDADRVMATMTETVVFEPAFGPEAFGARLLGRSAVRAAFVAVWTAMPDVEWQVVRQAVDGDHGMTEWLFIATREGRAIRREGLDLFRFEGTLVTSKRAFRKAAAG